MPSFLTPVDPADLTGQLRRERDRLRRPIERQAEAWLAGEAPASVRLREDVDRVARTPGTTVLLMGPEGAGKELVAQAIHARSQERAGPLRAVSSGSWNADRLDALFEDALGGTLLLNDIELLPLAAQARLARFLEEARRSPLIKEGSSPSSPGRLIASTSADLDRMVSQGAFDDELYYRLNVLGVRVPNLRDRRKDLPAIAVALTEALPHRGAPLHLDVAGQQALSAQEWPGGWRQIINTLERAALLTKGSNLDTRLLWEANSTPVALPAGEDRSLKALEATWIERVLEEEAGNRSRAARALGINRATLYNKLRDYGIA